MTFSFAVLCGWRYIGGHKAKIREAARFTGCEVKIKKHRHFDRTVYEVTASGSNVSEFHDRFRDYVRKMQYNTGYGGQAMEWIGASQA